MLFYLYIVTCAGECETEVESSQGTIDVWIVGSWAVEDLSRTLSLLLQLAHIIHEKKEWKKQTHLRLLQVIDPISPLDSVNKDKPFQCGAGTAASRKHNLTQEKINNTDTQLNEDEESDIKSQRMKDAGHENFAFAVGQNVRILLVRSEICFIPSMMYVHAYTYSMPKFVQYCCIFGLESLLCTVRCCCDRNPSRNLRKLNLLLHKWFAWSEMIACI